MPEKEKSTLWTRDFTIITAGSAVSMFGNAMSGFAMSLMVLDYTESTLLYAVYLAVFTIPQIIVPIISGAVLDRFSRRKTIYTLDFLSSILYLIAAFILAGGWFSFPVFALYVFLIGTIHSIYLVAYSSFYPLLITKGNYSKAYSVSSVLETMSAIMVPAATFVYKQVGISPLLAANAFCFFLAAVMETRIAGKYENYVELQKKTEDREHKGRMVLRDIREGFDYLTGNKGLTAIVMYFTVSALVYGATNVLTLPWFRASYDNGEYIFMIVAGMSVVGRAVGGALHYRMRIPPEKKFRIAFFVYIVTAILEGTYLYLSLPLGALFCFMSGILGVTSYTIRVSATQAYVPDEKKGRFNGAFNMLNTCGSLVGELTAGWLALMISPRLVISGYMVFCLLSAFVFIWTRRREVAAIYNVEQ